MGPGGVDDPTKVSVPSRAKSLVHDDDTQGFSHPLELNPAQCGVAAHATASAVMLHGGCLSETVWGGKQGLQQQRSNPLDTSN
jgi:hypothetical protein